MVGDPSPPPEAISRRVMPDVWLVSAAGMPPVIGQGMTLDFTLDWYAARSAPGGPPLKLVARRLHRPEDARGVDLLLWEGHPVRGTYPMARWSAGERVIDRHNVSIPPDFPPGDYTLRLLLGESPAFESALRVEAVERHFELPPLATSVDLSFGDALTLRGYQVERAGSSDIDITLAWRAVRPPDRDYTVFVHVVGADGVNFSQRDEQPARPTSQWIAGEVMVTRYRLPLPPGAFTIRAGLYVQDDGRRLDIRGPAGEHFGDFLELAPNLSR
jgi:hypothetical protein